MPVRLEQAIGDGPDLSLYLDAWDGENSLAAADLGGIEVHVSGQPATVESVVDFADSEEGVAYIFLVDVSKSLNKKTYESVRDALSDWIRAMKREDMAAIISFGDSVEHRKGFTKDYDALQAAVAELAPTDNQTLLYQGLKSAMELGASHRTVPDVPKRKLIVTLSDGEDDLPSGAEGLDLQEVEAIIRTTRIPIHAIAFNAKPAGRRALGKLTRLSGGILLQAASRTRIAGSYANLRGRINRAIVVQARCENCPQDGALHPLGIRFTDGTSVPGDLKVRMSPARTRAPMPAPIDGAGTGEEAPPEAFPAGDGTVDRMVTEPSPQETSWIADWRLWAGIGILLALAAVGMAFLGNRRRQETISEPPTIHSGIGEQPGAAAYRSEITGGFAPTGGKHIRLSMISGAAPKGQTFEVQVSDSVLLGRSDECQVVIPGDEEISRRHARIDVKNDRLIITDMKSTHGTYVNGVPVHGERVLEDGDILRLGRTELHLAY
ncbi:MAG: FHA domain-containing protein [Candidatus Thiosymbion ectosymbiont of Robbea hypermnestra]|nr:FHA domain-containing protein [Candidatus Thiosymbion ectosymbiont of Robbea hypermnestra]